MTVKSRYSYRKTSLGNFNTTFPLSFPEVNVIVMLTLPFNDDLGAVMLLVNLG